MPSVPIMPKGQRHPEGGSHLSRGHPGKAAWKRWALRSVRFSIALWLGLLRSSEAEKAEVWREGSSAPGGHGS